MKDYLVIYDYDFRGIVFAKSPKDAIEQFKEKNTQIKDKNNSEFFARSLASLYNEKGKVLKI